jgi:hypothetical protein
VSAPLVTHDGDDVMTTSMLSSSSNRTYSLKFSKRKNNEKHQRVCAIIGDARSAENGQDAVGPMGQNE